MLVGPVVRGQYRFIFQVLRLCRPSVPSHGCAVACPAASAARLLKRTEREHVHCWERVEWITWQHQLHGGALVMPMPR